MDPEQIAGGHDDDDGSDPPAAPNDQDITSAEAALSARLSRKRTKTGCLTCRRRRIKCGEERPTCKNCIKSKRVCEGYSQRVVFKQPAFDHPSLPHGANQHLFPSGSGHGQMLPFVAMPTPGVEPMGYGTLQTRPGEHFPVGYDPRAPNNVPSQQMTYYPGMQTGPSSMHGTFQRIQFSPMTTMPSNHANIPMAYSHSGMQHHIAHPSMQSQMMPRPHDAIAHPSHITTQTNTSLAGHQLGPSRDFAYMPPAAHPPTDYHGQPSHATNVQTMQSSPYSHYQPPETPMVMNGALTERDNVMRMSHGQVSPISAAHSHQGTGADSSPGPQYWSGSTKNKESVHANESQDPRLIDPSSHVHHATGVSPTSYQQYVRYREQELPTMATMSHTSMSASTDADMPHDENCDTSSDDDMAEHDQHGQYAQRHDSQVALGRILGVQGLNSHDEQRRRYDTFIYAGFMDQYVVKQVANVIRDDSTKRVFAHFIAVTGPSLSIFQRHHCNTSAIFSDSSVPPSQQGLWTYSLPKAALRNQGLMHAMLALASLHIARLQDATTTPSLQHYEWAIRSIHGDVGHPKRRLRPTTVAASLLLGLYEVWTADHFKWSTHLAGSSQLFIDINFRRIMQSFRLRRQEFLTEYQAMPEDRAELLPEIDALEGILNVDENIVSDLVGQSVRRAEQPASLPSTDNIPRSTVSPADFEILRDLYWWYCKQDVYYSIVSGNPLLMKFGRWADCPPRAPLGDINAVYGSFDHLLLLLGRVADFASRDRERKLKQMRANGGLSRPPAGPRAQQSPAPTQAAQQQPLTPVSAFGEQQPGSTASSQGTMPDAPASRPPMFFGMAPAFQGAGQMPQSYVPVNGTPTVQNEDTPCTSPESYDLEAATRKAQKEWDEIKAALALFHDSLGEAFQPLTSDYHPSKLSAFGPIAIYRRKDIGCLWAFYHMAEIIAIRSRPDMPPYMHVAAGVAAQATSHHAKEIGRISAGLFADVDDTDTDHGGGGQSQPQQQHLNPTLGAALCESCMPSFFAAIQYRAPAERDETVRRIYQISRRTGWGSGELIANGCETAWVKADEATGRHPPYARILGSGRSTDPRLNRSWETLNLDDAPPDRDVDEADRRLVKKEPKARLFWGIGVMGREGDL